MGVKVIRPPDGAEFESDANSGVVGVVGVVGNA